MSKRTGIIGGTLTSLDVAKKIASFAFDKKAEDIVILSMNGVVNYCDLFVICSGDGARHARAIADGIMDGLQELGIKVKYTHGLDGMGRSVSFSFGGSSIPGEGSAGRWILLDMGDVVTHIFDGDSREFYGLEHLWQEAKRINWR